MARKTQAERAFDALAEPRKFRHVAGFSDGTAYLAYYRNGRSELVSKDGRVTPRSPYPLKMCLKFVKEGVWEEF